MTRMARVTMEGTSDFRDRLFNKARSSLPYGFENPSWPQEQHNHHGGVGKNNGELGPEEHPESLGETENERTDHGAPHVPQAADGDDEKPFNDDIVVHAEGYADGGGHQGAAQTGHETTEHKGESKHPAPIDPHGPYHLPVHSRRPGDLSQLGLVGEEPKADGHQRPDDEQKEIVPRDRCPQNAD